MQGPSRGALRTARGELERVLPDVDRTRLGEELLSVAGVVHGSVRLRRALADPSREGTDKSRLAAQVLGEKVSPEARGLVETVVAQRWSEEVDLTVALESLGVEAILAAAEQQRRLDQVEDELFRFSRIATGTPDLRAALVERRAPAEAKAALVDRLLGGRASAETERLVRQAVTGSRLGRFDRALQGYLEIAARRQEQLTAVVTVAVPLDEAQRERLVRALSEQTGRAVHANVIIDPEVVGGVRVQIGDEVIDGTVAHRLDEARRHLAG